MNNSNKTSSWLQIAFTEQVDRINESYFFDRRNNEFYSVFITDYLLIDPNSAEDYSNSPYSKDELAILSERIDRQKDKSSFILCVPRLTIEERREMMQAFIDDCNIVDKNQLQRIANAENGRTNLDFNAMLPAELNKDWNSFKYDFITGKIDSFLNLNNIDLTTSIIWTDKKMTAISLGVDDNSRPDTKKLKRPWWKLW